jgi:hypothetical protein
MSKKSTEPKVKKDRKPATIKLSTLAIIIASLVIGGTIAWFSRGLIESTIDTQVIHQVSQLK